MCGIIRQVCQIIWIKLKNTVMSEPNKQEWLKISRGFEKHANFPNCIGALGKTNLLLLIKKNVNLKKQYFLYK